MLVLADVHGAFDDLARVVETGESILILGDLLNFVDYRTGDGIAADVFGLEFATAAMQFRRRGDFAGSRNLWRERSAGREDEVRATVGRAIKLQYEAMQKALAGGRGFVTHGNVDVPKLLQAHLPDGYTYVDAEVIEIDDLRVGIVGGGTRTGLNAAGEISEDDMATRLERLGPVDILGTHVPPAVDPLRRDVITGRLEGGSQAVSNYLERHQPAVHYFGDIHQPQATTWRIGATRCINVGYFRATGRATRHV
jgi:Icc-related predicted phosphoesterase